MPHAVAVAKDTHSAHHHDRHAAKASMALNKLNKSLSKLPAGALPTFTPKYTVDVTFPSGKHCQGKDLPSSATLSQPKLHWPADPDALYTVALIDTDYPTRANPKEADRRLWLVSNVRGDTLDLDRADELTPFEAPVPEAGSGPHWFVFLVFRQSQHEDRGMIEGRRERWDAAKWCKGMTLEGVNFFQGCEKA